MHFLKLLNGSEVKNCFYLTFVLFCVKKNPIFPSNLPNRTSRKVDRRFGRAGSVRIGRRFGRTVRFGRSLSESKFHVFPHCVLLPTTTLIDFFASKVTINDARIVRKWNAYDSLLTILLLETFWRKILRFDAFYFQLTMVVETKWMCCGYWKIIFGQG